MAADRSWAWFGAGATWVAAAALTAEVSRRGDAALAMVLHDQDLLCEDTLDRPRPGRDGEQERGYRTSGAVSVIADDIADGMLTPDALEPGEPTLDDLGMLRMVAGALAVAQATPRVACRWRHPVATPRVACRWRHPVATPSTRNHR